MIVTVTPNAAVDITYTVDGFSIDRVHRPKSARTVAGGKGINVVRVLKELGRRGMATGFVGGKNGDVVLRGLDEEKIAHDFVSVSGESRLCIAIMDTKSNTQTEVNELGPEVTSDEVRQMIDKVRRLIEGKEYLVLCGSVPPGVPTTFYGDLIEMGKSAGAKTVLDTSGDHLREAIKAAPYMVKPNVVELSQLAGRELLTLEEISRAAKSLKQYGVSIAAVTMGRSGAMVTDGVQGWKAAPPEITFASAVGSGDSFVAAFIDSIMRGEALPDALGWGTAAGAANASTYGAGFCRKESIIELKKGVTVTKIS